MSVLHSRLHVLKRQRPLVQAFLFSGKYCSAQGVSFRRFVNRRFHHGTQPVNVTGK